MKEKLIIKNFGPIKEVELDLGRFNILIGEQATGKSTVAKVLAVCRYFSYIVDGKNFPDYANHGNTSFYNGLVAKGLIEYIKSNSYIEYRCSNYSLVAENKMIQNENDYFSIRITDRSLQFENLIEESKKIQIKSGPFLELPASFFLNDVKNVMDNPFYLPTERGLQSIFSIGQSSIQNLSDSLFNQLAKMDGIARLFTKDTYIEPLGVLYKNVRGQGFIRKENETEYYSLYNAASGYQSMIPIVLAIKYYIDTKKKSKTLLIEEPELDVFPTAQDNLIHFISEKAKQFDSMVLITTHSPYTLSSINNLTYAYQVGQVNEELASDIIDKKYWLNPEDVSAYMMKTDGGYEDIFDREEGMIKAEKIDNASTNINETFDKLLNIEFKKK